MTWASRDPEAAVAYDIEPQYERAFHGLYPSYFASVTASLLCQDGWIPSWELMWAHSAPVAATWNVHAPVAATWTERT